MNLREFQNQCASWLHQCVGGELAVDKNERIDRLFEEAVELAQSAGYSEEQAHAMVSRQYARAPGVIAQEVAGLVTTLAVFCEAHGISLERAAMDELSRVHLNIDEIRKKNAAKNRGLPRAGDHVHHKPSGEFWVVAWAEKDDLAPCGWPYCVARVSDCEVIKRCTDEEHRKIVNHIIRGNDELADKARRLYCLTLDELSYQIAAEAVKTLVTKCVKNKMSWSNILVTAETFIAVIVSAYVTENTKPDKRIQLSTETVDTMTANVHNRVVQYIKES